MLLVFLWAFLLFVTRVVAPESAVRNPALVPLHQVSAAERAHPLVVWSPNNLYDTLRNYVVQVEAQGGVDFLTAQNDLRQLNPFFNLAIAGLVNPRHSPLHPEGLDAAFAAFQATGQRVQAVLSELACLPPPPTRDIFPLFLNAPGPSARHMRARATILQALMPGVHAIFRDFASPCLGAASEGRRIRCNLVSASDPPPKRWREVGELFLRLYISCAGHQGVDIIAHFTNGRWAGLEAGVVKPDEPVDLLTFAHFSPITHIRTFLGYHSRAFLTSPHLPVRSLGLAREAAQLAYLVHDLGFPVVTVDAVYGALCWYLNVDPNANFVDWPTLAQELGINGAHTVIEIYDLVSSEPDDGCPPFQTFQS